MAEPLKNLPGPPVVEEIARQLARAGDVREAGFREDALSTLEERELMDRVRHVADAMSRHLPPRYEEALEILRAALHPETDAPLDAMTLDGRGLRGWSAAPMGEFVARNGLDRPEQSLAFLREMTQRFSAEFAVRPFLRDETGTALAHASRWARDPNFHVRRLASEGARPRLPWGLRLKRFVDDPEPLFSLLAELRDDPEEYVRRSAANNLNDISRDHPDRVAEIAADWLGDAPPERRRMLKHACRTLIKNGHPETLATFGYSPPGDVGARLSVSPGALVLGETLSVELEIASPVARPLLVDLVVHFRKSDGRLSPKAFKWTETEIAPGVPLLLRKSLPLRPVTVRRHFAGTHAVEAQVNGRRIARAEFVLEIPE